MLTFRASPISSSELDRLGFSEGGGGREGESGVERLVYKQYTDLCCSFHWKLTQGTLDRLYMIVQGMFMAS